MRGTAARLRPKPKSLGIEIVAGFTVFLACSYIVFLAPAKLAQIGFDYGDVITGTCIAATLGCFLVAALPGIPNVIAPATGIILLSVDAVRVNQARMSDPTTAWQGVLAAGLAAGLCVWLCSFLKTRSGISLRIALLELIPAPLKAAVVSGIGGLLAGSALLSVGGGRASTAGNAAKSDAIVFVIGVAIIVLIELCCRRAAQERRDKFGGNDRLVAWLELGASSAILVSIVFMLLAVGLLHGYDSVQSFDLGLVWLGADPSVMVDRFFGEAWIIGLFLSMLFTLLIDFVGSPYDMRRIAEEANARPTERQVSLGFRTDSSMMVIAPFLGITPTVYFGENHAARLAGGRTYRVAVVAGLLFLLLSALVVAAAAFGWHLNAVITPLVLAPAVFWIGVKISGETMIISTDGEGIRLSPRNVTIPAAIASVVGAVYSFPAAIFLGFLVYLVLIYLDRASEGLTGKEWPVFFMTILAGIAAFVN